MNILDTFFDGIDWNGDVNNTNRPRPFLKDTSTTAYRKHSYAMQVMDDCLTIEKRYTPQDLFAESIFLKTQELNKESSALGNASCSSDTTKKKKLRPGEVTTLINYPRSSSFSVLDIKKYRYLCFKMKSGPEKPTLVDAVVFEDLDKRLKAEQAEFQEFARKQWIKENYLRHGHILPDVKKYVDEVWQARINRLTQYPQWYKQTAMLPLVYHKGADNESNEINMVPGKMLHKQGKPARYVFLHFTQQHFLCSSYNDLVQEYPPDSDSKYPAVSQDPLAENLVKQSDAQVVISSSGLKCLLDNHSTNLTAVWNLPICIKEYKHEKGTRRVVYIDKKLPPKSMTYSQRVYWYSKIATRLLFCQHRDDVGYRNSSKIEPSVKTKEPKSFGSWETLDSLDITDDEKDSEMADVDNSMTESANTDESDDENLIIDMECDDNESVRRLNKPNEHLKQRILKRNNFKDSTAKKNIPTERCMSGSNDSSLPLKHPEKVDKFSRGKNDLGNKNCYVYQMWKLGKQSVNQLMKSDGEIIPIMVRSRRDCVNDNYKQRKFIRSQYRFQNVDSKMEPENRDFYNVVALSPKLEYQFDYGAERSTSSECIRQWVDTVVRPGCNLYRVRINPLTGEIIQMEKMNQQKLNIDGLSKNINLSQTWCSLYSVLSRLINCPPGNYMLEHSPKLGAFCALSVATEKPGVGTSNLYSSYDISVEQVAPIQAPWNPLDETIHTPMCRYKYVLPLIFPPGRVTNKFKPTTVIGKPSTIRNRKKKKRKNKKNKGAGANKSTEVKQNKSKSGGSLEMVSDVESEDSMMC